MQYKSVLAMSLLMLAVSWVGVGDMEYQVANCHMDDDVAFYAMYAEDPGAWEGDVVSTYADQWTRATVMNWGPVLLQEYAGIPGVVSHHVLFVLQDVLLALSLLVLARVVSGSWAVAWCGALFACNAGIWQYNLALFRSTTGWALYAGQLVLPFVACALALALKGRHVLAGAVLTAAAFVHVNLAAQAAALLALWHLLGARRNGPGRTWRNLAPLGLVFVVAVCMAVLFQAKAGDRIPTDELMTAFRHVQHFFPWDYGARWTADLTVFLVLMGLAGLSLTRRKDVRDTYPGLLGAVALGAVLLAVVHVAGAWAGIPLFVKAVPLRATAVLLLLAAPLMAVFLVHHLTRSPALVSGAALTVLVAFSVDCRAIAWGALASLALYEYGSGGIPVPWPRSSSGARLWRMAAQALFAFWGLAVPLSYLRARPLFDVLLPHDRKTPLDFVVGMVAVAITYALLRLLAERFSGFGSRRGAALGLGVCLLCLVLGLGRASYLNNLRTRGGDVVGAGNVAAQKWARRNTPPDAVFLSDRLSFRGLSHRRQVMPGSALVFYRYSESRRIKDFEDAYRRFYGLEEQWRTMKLLDYRREEGRRRNALDAQGMAALARRFGADYIVRLAKRPLDLPEAYRNEGVVIYKVPAGAGVSRGVEG